MNQSHFKVKACNGYQARENTNWCQGREKSQPVPRAGKLSSELNLILLLIG